MLTRQQQWLRCLATSVAVAVLVCSTAQFASAQEENRSSAFADIVKGVVFDPTTYAPALIGYHSTMRDWKTSQPFFQNGFVEHNYRFTVTGLPNDGAVSYEVGKHRILMDAVTNLEMSMVNNVTSRIFERALLNRYPDHRKMVKTIGWIQRLSVASVLSYNLSAAHYRQAEINAQRAREMGF